MQNRFSTTEIRFAEELALTSLIWINDIENSFSVNAAVVFSCAIELHVSVYVYGLGVDLDMDSISNDSDSNSYVLGLDSDSSLNDDTKFNCLLTNFLPRVITQNPHTYANPNISIIADQAS